MMRGTIGRSGCRSAGAPFELIARQLGHRDIAMVAKVYGRFKPDTEERDRWERIAAASESKNGRLRVPSGGHLMREVSTTT